MVRLIFGVIPMHKPDECASESSCHSQQTSFDSIGYEEDCHIISKVTSTVAIDRLIFDRYIAHDSMEERNDLSQGTFPDGTGRLSVGILTTIEEVNQAAAAFDEIASG